MVMGNDDNFSYEKQLWDQVILKLVDGSAYDHAIMVANKIIEARRNNFKETN